MYQRKYYLHVSGPIEYVGIGETHLARANFVECDKGECLRKHRASKVFLREEERRHDQREQDLREESQ